MEEQYVHDEKVNGTVNGGPGGFPSEPPSGFPQGPPSGFPQGPPGDFTGGPPRGFEIPTAKSSEISVTDYMQNCLEKVASAEGFKNFEIKANHGSAVGDGFVGILVKITIQENERDKKLSVVVKTPPENKARRQEFNAMAMFEREVFMYNEVLPAFAEFQEERKVRGGFFDYPKCYFAEFNKEKNEAIIIMEDLSDSGYKMWDKFYPVNYDHTKLVVEALGRFHAVSFAMKVQKPELFEKFQQLQDMNYDKYADKNFTAMILTGVDRAIATLDENDTKRRNRAATLKNDFEGVMKDLVSAKHAEPYAIVTHGDCWSNNFMFHYERRIPKKIMLLDWQASRYCSPVLDLVFFIFLSTDGQLRESHYDELINIYHRSLKALLDHLGGDTMSQFPFTALIRQLKQFGRFSVIMSTLLIPMITTKTDNLPDMDFLSENMKNDDPAVMEEMMNFMLRGSDQFASRMKGILVDAMRYNYL